MDIATHICRLIERAGLDPSRVLGPSGSVVLRDDGEGAYIARWDDAIGPRPTSAEIEAALAAGPSLEDLEISAAAEVDAHVERAARSRGYNSAASCASYVMSTNLTWEAEAHAFVAWRDAVWGGVYAILAAVESGTEPLPTLADLIAGLPPLVWPD